MEKIIYETEVYLVRGKRWRALSEKRLDLESFTRLAC